jgi:hypothetical protein
MKLQIIKYKNYGCTISLGNPTDLYYTKHYYSFYELNNGKIIFLLNLALYEKNKLVDFNYTFDYTKAELKSGAFFNYNFGEAKGDNEKQMNKEFFDYFNAIPMADELKKYCTITNTEEKCVKDFYLKYIEPTKDIKTDTINI